MDRSSPSHAQIQIPKLSEILERFDLDRLFHPAPADRWRDESSGEDGFRGEREKGVARTPGNSQSPAPAGLYWIGFSANILLNKFPAVHDKIIHENQSEPKVEERQSTG